MFLSRREQTPSSSSSPRLRCSNCRWRNATGVEFKIIEDVKFSVLPGSAFAVCLTLFPLGKTAVVVCLNTHTHTRSPSLLCGCTLFCFLYHPVHSDEARMHLNQPRLQATDIFTIHATSGLKPHSNEVLEMKKRSSGPEWTWCRTMRLVSARNTKSTANPLAWLKRGKIFSFFLNSERRSLVNFPPDGLPLRSLHTAQTLECVKPHAAALGPASGAEPFHPWEYHMWTSQRLTSEDKLLACLAGVGAGVGWEGGWGLQRVIHING